MTLGGVFPKPGGNGQDVVWCMYGVYEYAMEEPFDYQKGVNLGRNPNQEGLPESYIIQPDVFKDDIIG